MTAPEWFVVVAVGSCAFNLVLLVGMPWVERGAR